MSQDRRHRCAMVGAMHVGQHGQPISAFTAASTASPSSMPRPRRPDRAGAVFWPCRSCPWNTKPGGRLGTGLGHGARRSSARVAPFKLAGARDHGQRAVVAKGHGAVSTVFMRQPSEVQDQETDLLAQDRRGHRHHQVNRENTRKASSVFAKRARVGRTAGCNETPPGEVGASSPGSPPTPGGFFPASASGPVRQHPSAGFPDFGPGRPPVPTGIGAPSRGRRAGMPVGQARRNYGTNSAQISLRCCVRATCTRYAIGARGRLDLGQDAGPLLASPARKLPGTCWKNRETSPRPTGRRGRSARPARGPGPSVTRRSSGILVAFGGARYRPSGLRAALVI